MYSRASFPAVYNRSYICETECEAILEIYPFLDDNPVYLGEELRSIERGDTVRVVEIGRRLEACSNGQVPTARLETVKQNGLPPFEARITKCEYGYVLRDYMAIKQNARQA
ncbi:hypothetical protein DMP05_06705 [Slackia isoflavoniconvertens]|uniref:Uncharacterized protein n=1 Tax=Slackia isoflavoniconvertens TaxID=572010 RepID=A0A3N0IB55_9ACTN|nr:hypothetical protein DMP05_06705 [Slackia isoflavoniconvertens]